MTTTIAGHTFVDLPGARACQCGRLWIDIAGATHDDIGKPDIAHTGVLNKAELEEIEAERDRLWAALCSVAAQAVGL